MTCAKKDARDADFVQLDRRCLRRRWWGRQSKVENRLRGRLVVTGQLQRNATCRRELLINKKTRHTNARDVTWRIASPKTQHRTTWRRNSAKSMRSANADCRTRAADTWCRYPIVNVEMEHVVKLIVKIANANKNNQKTKYQASVVQLCAQQLGIDDLYQRQQTIRRPRSNATCRIIQ